MFVKSNSYYSFAADVSFCEYSCPKPFSRTPAWDFLLRDSAACLFRVCSTGKYVEAVQTALSRKSQIAENRRLSNGNMSCLGTFFQVQIRNARLRKVFG